MSLGHALSVAQQLRDALAAEVGHSRDARQVLKGVRTQALLDYALRRETFNLRSAQLSADLAQAIAAIATQQGVADLTTTQLKALYPFEGEQLAGVFAEVRALASTLSELDALNQHLAERALAFVRAYVNHLAPRPSAYNRLGRPAVDEPGTHSEHA